jgi:chorismate mutase
MTADTPDLDHRRGQVLDHLRAEIARIDGAIFDLIRERVEVARQVGAAKSAAGMPILDPAREAAVVRGAAVRARDEGVCEDEIRQIYWQLIGLCRRAQQDGSSGAP